MKSYEGQIPPCGIFCGTCPKYVREAKPCRGADKDCRQCKGIYECCVVQKGHRYCYECRSFPCYRFKQFAKRWEEYGQDLLENQRILKTSGEAGPRDTHLQDR